MAGLTWERKGGMHYAEVGSARYLIDGSKPVYFYFGPASLGWSFGTPQAKAASDSVFGPFKTVAEAKKAIGVLPWRSSTHSMFAKKNPSPAAVKNALYWLERKRGRPIYTLGDVPPALAALKYGDEVGGGWVIADAAGSSLLLLKGDKAKWISQTELPKKNPRGASRSDFAFDPGTRTPKQPKMRYTLRLFNGGADAGWLGDFPTKAATEKQKKALVASGTMASGVSVVIKPITGGISFRAKQNPRRRNSTRSIGWNTDRGITYGRVKEGKAELGSGEDRRINYEIHKELGGWSLYTYASGRHRAHAAEMSGYVDASGALHASEYSAGRFSSVADAKDAAEAHFKRFGSFLDDGNGNT